MAPPLSSLLTPVTRDQALETFLGFLKELGFRTTSWQPGSLQRTFATAIAWLYSGATQAHRTVVRGGYIQTAPEGWAELGGESWYETARVAAVSAEGNVRFVADGSVGAETWAQDELVLSDTPDGSSGNIYRVVGPGAITALDEIDVPFYAVTPGAKANISSTLSGVTMYLLTPIPGVTAKIISDPLTGTWLTTAGTDLESLDRYRLRCISRWATLTYGSAQQGMAYKRWALEADPTVTDVRVIQGANAAEVRVICRTLAGGITGGQIATIGAYIQDGRRPINDVVTVESATVVSVPVVAAPVVRRGSLTQGQIQAALDAYFAVLPIGGKIIYPSSSGAVIYEDLVETMLALEGLFRARLSDPTADLPLGATEIAVPSYSISVTEVGSAGV
jgi:uncharacterized phage protein gp47/JayE